MVFSSALRPAIFCLLLGASNSLALPLIGKDASELDRRATAASGYSAIVAFGASYTDNAHSRSSQYDGSLRNYYPFSNYGGRYTDGPVAVEYMAMSGTNPALPVASGSSVNLIDYAYGGSMIDNSLEFSSWPATADQIYQYLSDLSSGSASVGNGKVLHYINSGINPLAAIWSTAVGAGSSSDAVSQAQASVTANVNAIASQLRSINTNGAVSSNVHGADFIVVGIPPLEIVPSYTYQANGDYNQLSLLKSLVAQFNSELQDFASTFAGETQNGKAWFFDLASLWYDIQSNPGSYGVYSSPITQTCYDSSSGSVCSDSGEYWYFDSLHPTTTIMQIIAQKINAVIQAGQ